MRSGGIPALLWLIPAACGFEHGALTDAGTPPPDIVERFASCKAILAASPGAPSGMYIIDPDGSGAEAAVTVYCDMTTAGGGWTLVFEAASPNIMATPTDYSPKSQTLMGAAQSVLVSYRDPSEAIVGSFATFDLPGDWRTAPPFTYANVDVTTLVAVDGGAPTSTMVRYGNQNFGNDCAAAWVTGSGQWGRICIVGTTAPFFTGFSTVVVDTCNDSLSQWDSTPCTTAKKFALAVR